ncbi:hypothetical protein CSAL01_11002 [Colletotrichum salicis]|uniref:Zn(2)-C6 fungal-type domain-containing protein n=1 Tax=Colletotrichum salicis TaxID=1209931 RepID=A0A135UG22_9PEZI|nr:hypothetical protein CSAL01_11002 [Colletotrichum salicis]
MQRARGGCMSCRRRERKCDRRRPFCEACTQRRIQCPGYSTPLRWVDGAANHPAVGEGSSSTGTPTELNSVSSQVALPSRPSPHVQTTHITDELFHKSYLDEGSSEMSVSSMEYIDTALKEFRREIVVHYDVMPAATACSGVLRCVLQLKFPSVVFGGGQMKWGEYVQCLLWDCWRFAGLLHIRRREQRRNAARKDAQFVGDDQQDVSPSSEIVLYRLVSGLHLFDVACQLPENQHLLCRNGIVSPLITACLETRLLKQHPDWKQTVDEVRAAAEKRDLLQLAKATWEVLDEAWMEFDVDAAIARKGQEVSLL